MRKYVIAEASARIGVKEEFIVHCIQAHWVVPEASNTRDELAEVSDDLLLDEEDVARARLIHELLEEFGANEASIPIILHLLDQLYLLRSQRRAA